MGRTLVTTIVLFAAFMVVGNATILGVSAWARQTTAPLGVAGPPPHVGNFEAVDAHLWRGAAPGERGYRELAARGVTTVVDLRAEDDLGIDHALLRRLGLRLVSLPIRDGQAPGDAKVDRFLDAVRRSDGIAYVHCGAGVGRTGTMAAAYLVASGQDGRLDALRRNLAVGPPSLEQIAYVAGGFHRPPTLLTATSRTLDAPRRIWKNLAG